MTLNILKPFRQNKTSHKTVYVHGAGAEIFIFFCQHHVTYTNVVGNAAVTIVMTHMNTFLNFISNRQIGKFINDSGKSELFFTPDEVRLLDTDGYLTDGRAGGLVIGKFHSEGGIHMLQPWGDKFKYVGEMESYEYLMNESVTKRYMDRLTAINRETIPDQTISAKPFDIPTDVKVIDVRHPKIEILLLSRGGHMIINRAASEKHLRLLDKINSEV